MDSEGTGASGSEVPGLTLGRLERIFLGEITADLIRPEFGERFGADLAVRQEHPQVVFLAAQPGAGAAAWHADIRREFDERGGIVPVVAENFRPYHPVYEETRAYSPQDLAAVTDPAVRWWADRSVEWLRTSSYNVLVEDYTADADTILATAGRYAEAGYDVHVVGLAVPPSISRLTIIESYARVAEVSGTGPWTSVEAHDAGYEATADVVMRAEMSAAVSRITIDMPVGAVHGPVYDVERGSFGEWRMRDPHGADPDDPRRSPIEVLLEARERRFSSLERRALSERLSGTLERLERLGVGSGRVYEMGVDIQHDLRSTGFEEPVTGRLDAVLADLRAANEALDEATRRAAGPGGGWGDGPGGKVGADRPVPFDPPCELPGPGSGFEPGL